ncbi:MAG TPA: T9SS type A sorting domain-containing protein, partial [Cytophagales bacterium]|nr:T9SS type A sorting domain-containing protein [Cytophagales bacterium]
IGMYVHWFGSKPWALNFNNKILNFFASQGAGYLSLYEYEGVPLATNNYHNAGLVGMNSTGALSANQSTTTWPYVDELWNLPVPSGTYRYYDGMLYMMSLLHTSGQFRVWKPGTVSGIQTSSYDHDAQLSIYPNPGKKVTIEASKNHDISIINSLGVAVWKGDIDTWNVTKQVLPKGLYFVKLDGKNIANLQRFVIE